MLKNINDYISLGVILFMVFSCTRFFVGTITHHEHKKTTGLRYLIHEFRNYSDNSEE